MENDYLLNFGGNNFDHIIDIKSIDEYKTKKISDVVNLEQVSKFDTLIEEAKNALISGLRLQGVNEDVINSINETKGLGIITYAYNVKKIATNQFIEDLPSDKLILITRVASKTLKYGLTISEVLIQDYIPDFKRIKEITDISSKILLASSFSIKTLTTSIKISDKKTIELKDAISGVKSLSLMYLLTAPLLITNAPYLGFVGAVANTATILSFAHDVKQLIYQNDSVKKQHHFDDNSPLIITVE